MLHTSPWTPTLSLLYGDVTGEDQQSQATPPCPSWTPTLSLPYGDVAGEDQQSQVVPTLLLMDPHPEPTLW